MQSDTPFGFVNNAGLARVFSQRGAPIDAMVP